MRKLTGFALAAAIACASTLAAQETPPPTDTLVDGVNAALDRGTDTPERPESVFTSGESAVSGPMRSLVQGIVALLLVLAVILGLYYALKRWGKGMPLLAGANLGKVLGRIYLDRGTSLHFVRVADRVLVVGVNNTTISTVAEFNAAAFEREAASEGAPAAAFNPDSFLAELQEHSRELKQAAGLPHAEEDEIAALRGDIQRLQRYLREENREPAD